MVKYLDNKSSGFAAWSANQNAAKKPSRMSGIFKWALLFAAAWMIFSYFFTDKQSPVPNPQSPEIEQTITAPTMPISGEKISADVAGLRISNVVLNDFAADKKSDEKVTLLNDGGYVAVGLTANGTTAPNENTVWRTTRMANNNRMMWRNPDGIEFTRTITIENFTINVRDEVRNKSARDVSFAPFARIVRNTGEVAATVETGAAAYANDDLEYESWGAIDDKSYAYQTPNGFIGFVDQYWETIAEVNSSTQTMLVKKVGDKYSAETAAAPVAVAAGTTIAFETKIFTGPRSPDELSASGIANLGDTMDYGWFWFLSAPFLWAMNWLHGFVGNYGVAIILLTIALRLMMWPLTRKSYTSMAAMQKMQPEMQRIQKLYANDKMRLQMEMMKLYQTHKTSPMSGCLPMLLQIPIFFALYKALLISVPMRHAGFLWIGDLSVMDPYYILPILMGVTMWWQQKLQTTAPATNNPNDPAAMMQRTMKWMPLIFTALFAWMPAGLVLYWTVSNLFGIGQMYVIKKK